ncbi:nucleotide exchange factor GrpE [Mycoplasma nasistruthionis]|uniref:Protein GrpE n=1 Tax=Mycoplasma nasistruthionis TaxID=353852 RepID=A0A4Y6I7R3_9MOLU|nr:nucleotide exchange factor GrpE [Mycoplasma nasistruthionis]QDF64948.1 nucleotide exchange factor GrpE [Mycoplasma nasistruthionis]
MEKIKLNEIITADFELIIDELVVPEYSKKFEICLGKDQYLPGFDKLIINRKIKYPFIVNMWIPKNYLIPEFAGKKAIITLNNINCLNQNKNDSLAEQQQRVKESNTVDVDLNKQIQELKLKLAASEAKVQLMEIELKQKASDLAEKAKLEIQKALDENNLKLKQEKEQIKKFALQNFLHDFIDPYNNFVLAVNVGQNSDDVKVKNYCLGFSLVQKQFLDVLEQNGATLIQPEVGTEYNPEFQEVIGFEQNTNYSNNTILKVVRSGVKVDNRLIKPASVILVKND